MTNRFLLFSLLVLLFTSCNKDEENIWADQSSLLLPQEIFDYFYVDTGSYWVYTETTTLVKDSNWCTSSRTKIDSLTFPDGTPSAIREEMFVYVENGIGDKFTYWARGNDSISSSSKLSKWKNVSGTNTKTLAAILPFEEGRNGSATGSSSIVTCDTILDSIVTPAGTFLNVLRYYDDLNATEGSQPTYYYVVKNVGIIRKELITSSETWELTNYNVNQP